MALARIYTGDDARCHIEDLDPNMLDLPVNRDGLPPEVRDVQRSAVMPAMDFRFVRYPDGWFYGMHVGTHRDYVVILSGGQLEVGTGDGTVRRFGVGDFLLYEDLTGEGHTSRAVGDLVFARVRFPNQDAGDPG